LYKLQERAKLDQITKDAAQKLKEQKTTVKELASQFASNIVKRDAELTQKIVMKEISNYQSTKISQINSILQNLWN
jgi:ribosomal protein S25